MSDLNDIHGYVRLARLLVWPALAIFIAVAIAVGIVLTHPTGAH